MPQNAGNSENAQFEDNIYFYHPDHLGSTSMVTNIDGEITQNVVYIPYGEVFVEERNGAWSSPYLFNAKELDEETGLYYYGARYLDPTGARWLSADPMWEKYMGMTPYGYCAGNPVKLVDPDGNEAYFSYEGTCLGKSGDADKYILIRESDWNQAREAANSKYPKSYKAAREEEFRKQLSTKETREITINDREAKYLADDSYSTTVESLIGNANNESLEFFCDVILNPNTATFEFAPKVKEGGKWSCQFSKKYRNVGGELLSYTIANVHAHHEAGNADRGDSWNSQIGYSLDDWRASKKGRNDPHGFFVMNIERNTFHYYYDGGNQSPQEYKGATDAKSIISFILKTIIQETITK